MATNNQVFVWGLDHAAYGPVELPTLVDWIKDGRVLANTWLFTCKTEAWQRAAELAELQMFFGRPASGVKSHAAGTPGGVSGRQLRRVKILGTLSDEQLETLARYVEAEKVPQWTVVVNQGESGDSMYFVLEGELRVRMVVMAKETILATLAAGDFFGDLAVFDSGPRAADVVANTDAFLAKLSARSLDLIGKESPELANAFLRAAGKTLTARIRADNKRHSDTVRFNRTAASS